jgi:hypothetical protein
MSLARPVIIAVTVEGRSKSEVARDTTGCLGSGCNAGAPSPGRGRGGVLAAIAKSVFQSAGGRC